MDDLGEVRQVLGVTGGNREREREGDTQRGIHGELLPRDQRVQIRLVSVPGTVFLRRRGIPLQRRRPMRRRDERTMWSVVDVEVHTLNILHACASNVFRHTHTHTHI